MATERTFSIIKPDATRRNLTGPINTVFEQNGLRIVAQKRIQMTQAQAEAFYGVHRERPFFGGLVAFMTSGPVVVQVLEGENAIAKNREVMGATDPKKAARSAPNSPRISRPIPCTARTVPRTRPAKSPSSSPASKSPADPASGREQPWPARTIKVATYERVGHSRVLHFFVAAIIVATHCSAHCDS